MGRYPAQATATTFDHSSLRDVAERSRFRVAGCRRPSEAGGGTVRARYADWGRWRDAHSARARSTAGTPITSPPTTAEPGRSKNTTCASTEDP